MPEGEKQPDKIRPKEVPNVEKMNEREGVLRGKAQDKTRRRQMEAPKNIREKNDDLKQAEYLGNFLEKVVPKQIAIGVIEDYKRELRKGIVDITKKRYDTLEEYTKAVRETSDKISSVFKVIEERIAIRPENGRKEAVINKIELCDVFEGKNIIFALKEGGVAKKEYDNMLKFKEFLPDNSPKVYDYFKLRNDGLLVMEKIEGKTLKSLSKSDIDAAIKVRPKLFFDLGRIIAVMNNNYFIHGDLYNWDNIMLSKDNDWKIIDFERSSHHEKKSKVMKAQMFFLDINKIGIDTFSDKLDNKLIKNDFYEGYLVNRNWKEYIGFISSKDTQEIGKILENISAPSEKTRNYLYSLIGEIGGHLKDLGREEKESMTLEKRVEVLKDFKNGVEKFLDKKTPAK